MLFRDRTDAGRRLGAALEQFRGQDAVVLGLPRGGVVVAAEVARALNAPLDVIVVRKLGVPSQPELAMGAIGEGDVVVLNQDVLRVADVTDEQLRRVQESERQELARRAAEFRGTRHRLPLAGRVAIVVDDGIATGSTALAACRVAREQGAARVVLAAPVASSGSLAALRRTADDVVVLDAPTRFYAVGQFYADFDQTTDREVVAALADAATSDAEVEVRAGDTALPSRLTLPANARGLVVFAHGSGSSMNSPRNQWVAGGLQAAGIGTLLFDLLTPAEEADRANVFDIALLGDRLASVTEGLRTHPQVGALRIGYFGASTGAGAALWAAADPRTNVAAVVSRGGRPDLAGAKLGAVRAPTLLIVGGRDDVVIQLNRDAASALRCEHELVVVPGATHLFEEPGALASVADLARDWFLRHLAPQFSS